MLEFGVSGLLYQSNLLMYDRSTESLWSQSLGEAVVGELTGASLDIVAFQPLTMEHVRAEYPDTLVLSRETGHARDYERNPYAGYEDTEQLLFDLDVEDRRYPLKAAMYVFEVDGRSVAVPFDSLPDGGAVSATLDGRGVRIETEGLEIRAYVDDLRAPGYVEMWFSWTLQRGADGIVWDPAEEEG